MTTELQNAIESAWEARDSITPQSEDVARPVREAITLLDSGAARVAEPDGAGGWRVNEWLKKAVLLSFRLADNRIIELGALRGWDKVPLKYQDWSEADFRAQGVRVVPPATVRRGAFLSAGVVLMPSFVNIGAWVGEGTMVDTWASIGSCAQIGANVHVSAGAGIGGVLEPLQAKPTIIEDDCFIGARSEIVEGVVVEKGAVISMGVFITQSTPILDRASGEILRGRVPAGSVVVAGSLPRDNGAYSLNCAVIVKRVTPETRAKVGLNALLRDL